jgi:hypothetical protein
MHMRVGETWKSGRAVEIDLTRARRAGARFSECAGEGDDAAGRVARSPASSA